MEHDAQSKIRHDLRTLLNHIAGYSDLLREDARELGHTELSDIFSSIFRMSGELKDSLNDLYRESNRDENAYGRLRSQVLSLLFDIISLGHSAKRISGRDGHKDFLPDVEKVLDSSDRIVDIIENNSIESLPEQSGAVAMIGKESELRHSKNSIGDVGTSAISGRMLIIDDDEINRHIMTRQLERQGHTVVTADSGQEALALLKRVPFDVILLDMMMPEMNGFQVLEELKRDEHLRDMPVIVISALEDSKAMARCIELGAEDYLPREFDPIILKARIGSILERSKLKRQKDMYVSTIVETQKRLQNELADAAKYVQSLLPPPIQEDGIGAAWAFIPSLSLGGDILGYHRLSDGRLVLYLIDVSGHGIEAALLSVTIMNVLKAETLPETDFSDPAMVLSSLNNNFRSEDQNNMYFTIWYGVYDPKTRIMTYSSGGNSSAGLVEPDRKCELLQTEGIVIGVDETFLFMNEQKALKPGSRIYVFSDGIYEVRKKEGDVFGMDEFLDILGKLAPEESQEERLASLVSIVRSISMNNAFEDDVSIIELVLS
jgi:sigma-B regulation protein RsbU (phosphoserine phosphatase)